jgi:peptide deformylase
MIRELVDCYDPILRQKTENFDFTNPPINPVELYNDLAETMRENDGLGLASPQVGLPYRVFVMRAENIIGVFNPRIVDMSSEMVYLEEGCLSYPNLWVKVKRPKKVKVRYTNPDGQTETRVFDGMSARVFQHEFDHLEGIVHTKQANRFHLEQARKLQKKLNKGTPVSAGGLRIKSLTPEAEQILQALKN